MRPKRSCPGGVARAETAPVRARRLVLAAMRPSRDVFFAVLLVGFTALGAILLKVNPVTGSEPSWYGAVVIAFVGNLALGLIALRWMARYVEAPALALAAAAMACATIGITVAGFAHEDVVFTQSDQQDAAARVTKPLFEKRVPASHQPYIPSATAVKLDEVRFRICVETPEDRKHSWCAVVNVGDVEHPKVESLKEDVSNYTVARRMALRSRDDDK